MESSWTGFGDRCVLQAVLAPGKTQQHRIWHHLNIDPCCSGGGFGCLCRALLTLPGLRSHRGAGMSCSFCRSCGCTAFCL